MPTDEVAYTSAKFRCLHCGNYSPFVIHTRCTDTHKDRDDQTGETWESGDMYSILSCPACSKISIARSFWHEGIESESEVSYEILYPPEEKTPLGLPDKIKKGFEAANKIKAIDANAYAVLLRRILELVCEDRQAKGKSLHKKLADLSGKGEIPSKLVDVANGLKNLGNVGAHADLGEVTEKDIPILGALINAILEYVYSAPYLAQIATNKFTQLTGSKRKAQSSEAKS